MAIPGGGSINLDIISDEFGGAKPDAISEYYRDGGLVPPESPGDIPESGPISWSDFYDSSSIIDPPIEVGELLMSNGVFSPSLIDDPRTTSNPPASGLGEIYEETFNFNPLSDNATYRVDWYMIAFASYGFVFGRVRLYRNNNLEYDGRLGGCGTLPGSTDCFYRDNSGQRDRSSTDITLGFGDEVRFEMQVYTRDSNKYTPNHTAFYAEIERIA